ncbi:MAG: site-specific integrase [Actinobacteria bacterium]|nr:site-specific integrase [Actinomycetota bacterium]
MSAPHGRRGSVRQDANGTWSFVVDAKDESGKRRQTRRRGFATRRIAQAELTRVLSSLADNTYVSPQTTTVGDFLVGTWLPAIEHTIKPATFESYRRNVRLHMAGRPIGRRRLQDVEPADLNALYSLLLRGDDGHRALSSRSVAYIAAIIHRALRDAVRWQLIVRNPADFADPPRPAPASQMRTWSAGELKTFLDDVADDRLAGAWWLLATTGMRRGEVLGLHWRDIDLDAGVLQIIQTLITTDVQRKGMPGMAWGTPKTGKGRRRVALDPATVAALRAHRSRQNQERLAFGGAYEELDLVVCREDGHPLHPKSLSYYFGQRSKRLELPRIRLHDLRHTHATLALRAGVHPRVVQERLGHANVSITLDTYSHVDIQMQADAAARVAALVTGADA